MMPWPMLLAGNVSTVCTGIGKTGIPGATILGAVMLANILPDARASVGILLPILVVADCLAVAVHWRDTRWALVARLMPWIALGIGFGYFILRALEGPGFTTVLGGVVLAMLVLDQLRIRLGWHDLPHHPVYAALLGIAGGITTTVGNLAGPVMTLYFLSLGLEKKHFMGSFAWLFFFINILKVPLFFQLGMIDLSALHISLQLLPGVLLGAWLGKLIFHRIPQKAFSLIVQVLAAAAAIRLLWQG